MQGLYKIEVWKTNDQRMLNAVLTPGETKYLWVRRCPNRFHIRARSANLFTTQQSAIRAARAEAALMKPGTAVVVDMSGVVPKRLTTEPRVRKSK